MCDGICDYSIPLGVAGCSMYSVSIEEHHYVTGTSVLFSHACELKMILFIPADGIQGQGKEVSPRSEPR